jgi:hypothetical protein
VISGDGRELVSYLATFGEEIYTTTVPAQAFR